VLHCPWLAANITNISEVDRTMEYVKFGSSDMMVSRACCGTMTWGSYNTEAQAFEQLDAAVAKGVNFFDTAEMYPVPGKPEYCNATEIILGNWLESRTKEGKIDRSKLYIATKVSGNGKMMATILPTTRAYVAARKDPLGERPPIGWDPEHGELPALTAEQIMEACQASLKRLRCEYIDLFQLHWPQRYVPAFGKVEYKVEKERPEDMPTPEHFDRQVLAVKALFDAKLIRNWGLSNETSFGLMAFCAACDRNGVPRPVSVQNDMSMMFRRFEEELAEVCRHMNIAGMPYGALAGGTLSGKYDDDAKEPPSKTARHAGTANFQPRYHTEIARQVAKKYSALARKHGLTPAQLALAWMKSRFYNTSVIIGSTSVIQIEENIDAFNITLSQEVLDEVDALHAENRNVQIKES